MSEAARFTRRAVLGGAAAAGAGLVAGPAVARAALAGAGGPVFSLAVGRVEGESAVLAPGRPFVLAGVQWAGPVDARIQLRARAAGGGWSRWSVASVGGHVPDRTISVHDDEFGEPVWFGVADEVQVRALGAGGASGVRLHFVAADSVRGGGVYEARRARGASFSAPALPQAQPVLDAGPGQPPIVARSAWAGARGPASGPYYGSIALAFVHHSDNPNGYSRGEVPAMILAIYQYHRYARGYFDIAYNFVIDGFGRIWEARAGGIDEPVIGAHAGGYNAVSTGICMLGTFAWVLPPPPAMDALQRLLAWKLALHGIPTSGRVSVEVNPSDAYFTRFRPGQHVLLPRIAGHRDGDTTDCPGNDLYHRLPAVRAEIGALGGQTAALSLDASATTLSLAPPAGSTPPGSTPPALSAVPVTLSGVLAMLGGAPITGAPLQIQTVTGIGQTATIATPVTGPDGSWSAIVTLGRSEVVRALCEQAPAAVSNLVAIGMEPVITLGLASSTPLRVAGTIAPAKRRVTVDVYKRRGARHTLVLSKQVPVRGGSFTARLALPRKAGRGSFEIVARTTADAVSLAGASPPVSVAV